jgi:hypothetical protein
LKISKVWEILGKFKRFCEDQGWKTCENEDWIEIDNTFHNFLWSREVHPESFRKIALDRKCVVREGLSYRVVEAAYTAWLFSQAPPASLVKTIRENPDFSKRIALYDLSQIMEPKSFCAKLNKTESHVFREFENFLQNELKVRVITIPSFINQDLSTDSCTVATIA